MFVPMTPPLLPFLAPPPDCTYCVWLFSPVLDVVSLIVSILFLLFCEMFYNVPAWGPVRKHFIFYILNIYACTWLTCRKHIHRYHAQQAPGWHPQWFAALPCLWSLLPFPIASLAARGVQFHWPPPGGAASSLGMVSEFPSPALAPPKKTVDTPALFPSCRCF